MSRYVGPPGTAARLLWWTTVLAAELTSPARGEAHDVAGVRSNLADAGVQLSLSYYGEALADPSGGAQQGLIYDGRLGLIVDGDLDKLVGWGGASFHASLHLIHGTGLSGAYVGNLMAVSGIEAPATTRLFNLWLEQAFGAVATLRVGQTTAAQEFLISQSANLFVNSSFGWPLITAADLPSGGPAYPEAALGARLKVTPGPKLSFMVAIFDGDPAGPGPGGPVDRDPHGLAFRIDDSPFLIGEVGYAMNPFPIVVSNHQEGSERRANPAAGPASGPPGTIKLGAWYHSGQFADRRFDAQGLSLADPNSTGQPLQHRGNWGLYVVLDQMLWRIVDAGGDRGLSGFLRASLGPDDRNLVDLYADVGFTFKGLISGRPDDTCGIALAYARISPQAADRDRDQAAITGVPIPIEDYEATLEMTYQLQIVDGWSLQPDVQYIVHPGGNVVSPLDAGSTSPMDDALVLGVRTMLRF